jgi:protein-S-isoprenylcysteine O-methyltransferase Ste14
MGICDRAMLLTATTLSVVGVGVLAWAAAVLGWRRWLDLADTSPALESPALVLSGPFGIVRHPQSLALLMLLAAAAIHWPWPGLWVLAAIAGTIIVALAAAEEPRLAKRFGSAYRRYRRAVPFLLPRWW